MQTLLWIWGIGAILTLVAHLAWNRKQEALPVWMVVLLMALWPLLILSYLDEWNTSRKLTKRLEAQELAWEAHIARRDKS